MHSHPFVVLPAGVLVRAPKGKGLIIQVIDLPKTDEDLRRLGRPSRDGKKL